MQRVSPIVNEMENFSILVDDEGNPDKTMIPVFEEQTNVRLDVMAYPNNIAGEHKNILMASGDYLDVIAGWLFGAEEIVRLREECAAIPLSEMIDKYTVNMKEALEFPGVREALTHPDGEIYTLPYVVESPLASFSPWINVEWLKQVGLPMPTTTEEFKNTLIAFKNSIPPVNGQPIIPFSAKPNNFRPGALAGWFGVNAQEFFAMIDGRLEITINRPEYKEFLKYFSDLYTSGLVDAELFSQNEQQWKAKGVQGLYGVAYAYWPADFAPMVRSDVSVNQYDYEALPVLRGPNVETPLYWRASNGYSVLRTQAIITDKAKNPLTIIRWFDNLYDEANSLSTQWGHIGIRFEQLSDGTFRETANGRSSEAIQAAGEPFFNALPKFQRPGVRMLPPEGQAPEYYYTDVRDVLYEPYLDELVPEVWLDRATSQQIVQLNEGVAYYYNQKMAEWITGQADIESQWDAYLADLDNLGINELLEIRRGLIENR